ncbi:O-antigen polymerase [Deinococcus sp.]|uniref:O-antigen polymerase n=1 Tax=Deinococcus sp. TaxID=47478 RepID=UPI003C7DD9B6
MIYFVTIISFLSVVVFLKITRSLSSPCVLMSLTWTGVFIGLSLNVDFYDDLQPIPLFYLLLGSLIFSTSSFIFQTSYQKRQNKVKIANKTFERNPMIPFFIFILIILLPFYIRSQLADLSGVSNTLREIRLASLAATGGGGFFANVFLLSEVVSIFALLNYLISGRKYDLILYLVGLSVAFLYGGFSGAKGTIINILIANYVAFIVLRPKRAVLTTIFALVASFAVLFLGLYFINFAANSTTYSFDYIAHTAINYFLGGTVAFSAHYFTILSFENHQNIQTAWSSIFRIFEPGTNTTSIHYPFIQIAPGYPTNVFTMYFPLIKEYTLVGCFTVVAIFGMMFGWVYFRARSSSSYLVLYSLFSLSIFQSIFSDLFLYASLLITKYIIVIALLSFASKAYYKYVAKNRNSLNNMGKLGKSKLVLYKTD